MQGWRGGVRRGEDRCLFREVKQRHLIFLPRVLGQRETECERERAFPSQQPQGSHTVCSFSNSNNNATMKAASSADEGWAGDRAAAI